MWVESNSVIIPNVNISFLGKKIYRNPVRSDIFFKEVIEKEFKVNGELVAFGWFLTCNDNKVLREPNAGIHFKKKGFTIGDSNLVERMNPTENYARWQYGEIHVILKGMRENAARNNFESNNKYTKPFTHVVGMFIKDLQNQNRYQGDKIQTKKVSEARNYEEKGNYEQAINIIQKARATITKKRKFPKDPALQKMEKCVNDISEQNMKDLAELEAKIKGLPAAELEIKHPELSRKAAISKDDAAEIAEKGIIDEKSQVGSDKKTSPERIPADQEEKIEPMLNIILNNLHPDLNAYVARSKKSGLEHFEISATDAIKDILIKRVGSSAITKEIFEMSQIAYGWGDVTEGKSQLLTIDKIKRARNWRFGAMIYTIHDLFINMYKHERGKESLKWFEEAPPEERKVLIAEAYAIIDLIYRLILKSEDNK